jgi:nitrous oxide reductase accessory protein NosL
MVRTMKIITIGIVVALFICFAAAVCRSQEAQPAGPAESSQEVQPAQPAQEAQPPQHVHPNQPAQGKACKECRICGMYIERFKRTAAYVEYNDGKSEAYCGVACAIRAINERGGYDAVKTAEVTAWTTQERVAMKEATYVIGSNLVPDMLPNIMAFGSEDSAKKYIAESGGKIEPLDELFVGTSYRGLTAPFRIPPAAVPSAGVLNVGLNYSTRSMDSLMNGATTISNEEGLKTRAMVPETMNGSTTMLQVGYGVTDDLFCQVNMPDISKTQWAVNRKGVVSETTNTGLGDISLVNRWRFWHDTNYDRHLGLLAAVNFPTGSYKTELRDKPTMQLGTGAYGFMPGLLYSQHSGQFWFHAAIMYLFNQQNSDNYKFGDGFRAGLAIHWLPNTSDLLGIEYDIDNSFCNFYKGNEVPNTGRSSAYYNLVYQRKVALFWGGNLNLNLLYGIPAFQRMNGMQLGELNHKTIGLQWQRRF